MALLTDAQRWEIWADYMSQCSNEELTFGTFDKPQLRTAINETDTWIEGGSKGQHRSKLGEPCKSELTAYQLTKMNSMVTIKRSG